ncbi:hypothetical protein PT974_07916 [Cladobotryum mycophilum]|uniref:mannan endo-1,4-beta-mannosidase n=1 Tax=Cladobotryum mycophilum TaxID=491253 RepID=A0ABR0SDD2_9HYPO
MKAFILSAVALALSAVASPALEKRGSKSFAGTSLYFLQGLSTDVQKSYLSTLANGGVKVVRLWVKDQPGQNTCVKGSVSVSGAPDFETTLGKYNWQTLDLLDQTLVYLQQYGLKAIISPHDGNKLNGQNGDDIYGQTYGAGYFYEQQGAYEVFDNRLKAILNYKGAHSGKVWKDWNEVILAFDIQNEPFASDPSKCQYATAGTWACGRAQTMRTALGKNNKIKIATGGFGGDISHGCTFLSAAMTCADIDIVSVHRYAGLEGNNQNQWTNSYKGWISQAKGKLVHLEEWGVPVDKISPTTEFPANTHDMNSAGLPWSYWQLLPAKTCGNGGADEYGFYVNQGVDWASQIKAANNANCQQDWNGLVW